MGAGRHAQVELEILRAISQSISQHEGAYRTRGAMIAAVVASRGSAAGLNGSAEGLDYTRNSFGASVEAMLEASDAAAADVEAGQQHLQVQASGLLATLQ